MNAKKSGKKGLQRHRVDAKCRTRTLDQFKHRHKSCVEVSNSVSVMQLPNGGVEAYCFVCGASQKFADQ